MSSEKTASRVVLLGRESLEGNFSFGRVIGPCGGEGVRSREGLEELVGSLAPSGSSK